LKLLTTLRAWSASTSVVTASSAASLQTVRVAVPPDRAVGGHARKKGHSGDLELGDHELQIRTIASAPIARASASRYARALGSELSAQRINVTGRSSGFVAPTKESQSARVVH
jgi:hypothetical protein